MLDAIAACADTALDALPVMLADGGDVFTSANLVNAIVLGATYAMVAVGYTMVYGIIKLINFAHGEVFMLGAVLALVFVGIDQHTGLGIFLAMVPAVAVCAAIGFTVDWTAYISLRRKLPGADWISVVLLILLAVFAVLYSAEGQSPFVLWGLVVPTAVAILAFSIAEKFGMLGRSKGRISVNRLNALITAIGMSLILQTLVQLLVGPNNWTYSEMAMPAWMGESFPLGPGEDATRVLYKEVLIVVVAVVMMITLQLLVSHTRIGAAMRATSQDPEAAQLMGIPVDKVIAVTFVIGSAMAAIAGVLHAAKVGGIWYRFGYYPGLIAFAAAVLGGIGSIRGAVLGGVLIGFVQGFTQGKLGTFIGPFAVMIVILIVRPWGILAKPETKRA